MKPAPDTEAAEFEAATRSRMIRRLDGFWRWHEMTTGQLVEVCKLIDDVDKKS